MNQLSGLENMPNIRNNDGIVLTIMLKYLCKQSFGEAATDWFGSKHDEKG